MGSFLLGFLLCAAIAAGAWYYFNQPPRPSKPATATLATPHASTPHASPPPKPADSAWPAPPFGISEDVFESGARLYTARCAVCHGTPARQSSLAVSMSPAPLQLWVRRDHSAAIGLSAQSPGEIYLHTRDGIPHTGMPAYKRQLTDTQVWQIALLLKSADQPFPDPVHALLAAEPAHKPDPAAPKPDQTPNW